jgi:hypothetical protein
MIQRISQGHDVAPVPSFALYGESFYSSLALAYDVLAYDVSVGPVLQHWEPSKSALQPYRAWGRRTSLEYNEQMGERR